MYGAISINFPRETRYSDEIAVERPAPEEILLRIRLVDI